MGRHERSHTIKCPEVGEHWESKEAADGRDAVVTARPAHGQVTVQVCYPSGEFAMETWEVPVFLQAFQLKPA